MKYLTIALLVFLSACGGDNHDMFQYRPDLDISFILSDSTR